MAAERELSFQPLYRQAIDLMVQRMAMGEWKPGDLLPPEPRLAEELGVSVGTVRKALDHLVSACLVHRRQGVGTFVATATREASLFRFFKLVDRERRRVMPQCEQLGLSSGPADAAERAALALPAESRVCRVERLRRIDGRPVMVDTVVLPLDRFPGVDALEAPLPPTLYDFFEARFGVTVLRVEEVLAAVSAEAGDAALLGVAPGAPLLCIERTALSFDDQPVERRVSRLDTRHALYRSELT